MKDNLIETSKMLPHIISIKYSTELMSSLTEDEQAILIYDLLSKNNKLIDKVAMLISTNDNQLGMLEKAVRSARSSNAGTKSTKHINLNVNPGQLYYNYKLWVDDRTNKMKHSTQLCFVESHIVDGRCIVDNIDYGSLSNAENILSSFKKHSDSEKETELALIEQNHELKSSLDYSESEEIQALKSVYNSAQWLDNKIAGSVSDI